MDEACKKCRSLNYNGLNQINNQEPVTFFFVSLFSTSSLT